MRAGGVFFIYAVSIHINAKHWLKKARGNILSPPLQSIATAVKNYVGNGVSYETLDIYLRRLLLYAARSNAAAPINSATSEGSGIVPESAILSPYAVDKIS